MIWVFHAGSRSWIWVLTFYPSQILILDPRSRIQGSKRHWSPDPGSGFATLEIRVCSGKAFMCKKEFFSVYYI
jgi:hypothetical protein